MRSFRAKVSNWRCYCSIAEAQYAVNKIIWCVILQVDGSEMATRFNLFFRLAVSPFFYGQRGLGMFKNQRVQITTVGLYAPHIDILLGLAKEQGKSASAIIRGLLEDAKERKEKTRQPSRVAGS